MIEKLKGLAKRGIYSLRAKMIAVIITGAVLGTLAYVTARFLMMTAVDVYYVTEEARSRREEEYIVNLQTYVDQNDISSEDTAKIASWVRQNRYAYLLVYKDDELFFSGGISDGSATDLPQMPGVSVDYPTLEEIKEYAEKNDLHAITVKDGTLFASVSDFSEYLYYDIVNIVSLIIAFVVLAVAMMTYFFGITRRITTLSKDVKIVSSENMNHSIYSEGNDELSTLTKNVEQMRSSIVENIEKERAALDANAELITSMSHDIRTPLTVLLGYLDLMKSQETNEVMQSYIKASEATALKLKELSDDMFRYFLVFGDREIDVELSDYDAATLLDQMLSEHILLLNENGYEVAERGSFSLERRLTVRTDAPKAMRIVDNIFSNIYKYAATDSPILVGASLVGERLYITVENKISPYRDRAESTGIGLKTCKKISEAIDLAFEYSTEGESFAVKIGFKVSEGREDDKLQ